MSDTVHVASRKNPCEDVEVPIIRGKTTYGMAVNTAMQLGLRVTVDVLNVQVYHGYETGCAPDCAKAMDEVIGPFDVIAVILV